MKVRTGSLAHLSLVVLLVLAFGTTGTLAIVAFETPKEAWGTVHVDGEPAGMAITLDGMAFGVVPQSGVLELDRIPVGGHTIGATMQGYQGTETQVTVLDGQTTIVRVVLTAISTGTLTVDSDPTNVQVYLDDVYKGITPVTLNGVQVGGHTVLLKLPGYQDWSSPVIVTAGGQELISGTLERIVSASGSTLPIATPSAAAGSPPGVVLLGIFIVMTGFFMTCRR